MSLKGFHIVFVIVSTMLCVFLAVWSWALSPEPSVMASALGIVGALGALLMPVYGVYFYRKASRIHL